MVARVVVAGGGIAGVKYAMDLRDYKGGIPRLPLLPLKEEEEIPESDLGGD